MIYYYLRTNDLCNAFETEMIISQFVEIIECLLWIWTSEPVMRTLFSFVCDYKSCFSIKKLILASERHAEHPFAGRNTQQML